jgi:hypothetical protein
MLLREADVVHCNTEDSFILDMDIPTLRLSMREGAMLVVTTTKGVWAAGDFGERLGLPRKRDAITTSICFELANRQNASLWDRVLTNR